MGEALWWISLDGSLGEGRSGTNKVTHALQTVQSNTGQRDPVAISYISLELMQQAVIAIVDSVMKPEKISPIRHLQSMLKDGKVMAFCL